jgi:hypothetical protein
LVVTTLPSMTRQAVGAVEVAGIEPKQMSTGVVGDSRSYRAQTMKGNKSSRTKTKTQDKGQPKGSFLHSRILKR